MSKIKISVIVILTFFISATVFVACNNEDGTQKDEALNIEKVLFEKYKLVKSQNTNINLSNLNSISSFTKTDEVSEYTIENSLEKVLIITNSSKPNSYVVIKGHNVNNSAYRSEDNFGFEITKELDIVLLMDANGDGSLNVKNLTDNEEFSQILDDGKPTELNTSNITSNRPSLCQREAGEGTKACYLREVDEFCDGFWGCAALATNASVHLLILALCSC
jgi:hypothetical protein